jgi:hypothetical protein
MAKKRKPKVNVIDVVFPLYGGAKKIVKSIKKRMSGKPVNRSTENTESSKTTYKKGGKFRTQHD